MSERKLREVDFTSQGELRSMSMLSMRALQKIGQRI
jgi:hypothetical protein